MTPKTKAEELISKFMKFGAADFVARECALIAVEEIENTLTEYGRNRDELQNMDSEWRYWEEVKSYLGGN